MREIPPIIDQPPPGARNRMRHVLRGRRFSIAAAVALAEVVLILVTRPSTLFASALVFVVLVLAVLGISRLGPGLARDLLLIVAISQGLVLLIPLVIGFSFVLGLIAAAVVLALVVAAAFRLGR